MANTTKIFDAMKAAATAFNADPSIVNVNALEAAEKAYFARVSVLKARWDALEYDDRKNSAEINAYDTDNETNFAGDEIRWFEIALGTYEEIGTY